MQHRLRDKFRYQYSLMENGSQKEMVVIIWSNVPFAVLCVLMGDWSRSFKCADGRSVMREGSVMSSWRGEVSHLLTGN